MDEVDRREKILGEEISLLQRFRKQNTRAMNIIDDIFKSPIAQTSFIGREGAASNTVGDDNNGNDGSGSHSWMSQYDELLERLPVETNECGIESEALVKTVDLFLSKWFVIKSNVEGNNSLSSSSKTTRLSLLPLSLSGGVDSMVLLKILSLSYLRNKYHYDVLSLHVDYGNRPEAAKESEFVQLWGRASHQGAM